MACDKQGNVRFRVAKKTDWWWEKAQDGVKRIKYFVRRDSDEADVLVACQRTDLCEGVTYVAENWCTLLFAKPFHFTEGATTEVDGVSETHTQGDEGGKHTHEVPPPAPQRTVGDIALSTELLHNGVFEVMREIKILASNAKDVKGDPMQFEGEDVRTMVIQAYKEGATRKMIDLLRAKRDDIPFDSTAGQ